MELKTVKVYTISELDIKIQERIFDQIRMDGYLHRGLSEYLTDILSEELVNNNIDISDDENIKVYYSLNNCQGDGVMFEMKGYWKDIFVKVKHTGHYYHYNSKEIEMIDEDGCPATKKEYDEFNGIYVRICRILEKLGYSQIEYEESDEYIKDYLMANEYKYYMNGDEFNQKHLGCY